MMRWRWEAGTKRQKAVGTALRSKHCFNTHCARECMPRGARAAVFACAAFSYLSHLKALGFILWAPLVRRQCAVA